jgi:hypothetical protein
MSLLGGLGLYLESAVLIALAFGALKALGHRASPKWGYCLLLAAFGLPLAMSAVPRARLLHPRAQVFTSHPRRSNVHYAVFVPAGQAGTPESGYHLNESALGNAAEGLAATILLFLLMLVARIFVLHRSISRLPVLKRVGGVSIHVSSDDAVAFSAWLPGRARVVLPEPLLTHRDDLAITLRHELQHQRHGDTRWLYLTEIAKSVFFWNPFAHAFARTLGDLQEYACDEFLVGHRKIEPREYGGCLLRAAELAVGSRAAHVGTTCMAQASHRSHLKRRIEMILNSRSENRKKKAWTMTAAGTLVLLGLASAAFAARSTVQDRALTLAEARAYASDAGGGEIQISMNQDVLRWLNYYIGTEEGRHMLQYGFHWMPVYKPMIETKLQQYGAPEELLAQPFVESAYNVAATSPKPWAAAGIWQFIPQTARKYGLVVTDSEDDRIDPAKETDAAMRYLRDLQAEFGDWRLSLLAYNAGETAVEGAITQTGTRDPWVIERNLPEHGYLASVEAMIIILKNPSLAQVE